MQPFFFRYILYVWVLLVTCGLWLFSQLIILNIYICVLIDLSLYLSQVDIPIKYLEFFLDDDVELEHIKREYGAGRLLIGEVKKRIIEVLTEWVEKHRRAHATAIDEMVDAFMAVRPLPNMFS
ncbi:unnamed protein product [Coffea canephora]|uniref:Uncharacterized protein n=1 Tax=Coffea canephora TaxID=49390 RepID=A0A068V1S8_COFCA|nr:unnamed protein product [Coffea canephora]